jgi:hexulose-6-phosphate isomerase
MTENTSRVGFIQGRLSPVKGGLLQEFPINSWQSEFGSGHSLGFRLIEWTVDQHTFNLNPIMTESGRAEIQELKNKFQIEIPSLTGDCFMQSPFWIHEIGPIRDILESQFMKLVTAASLIGVSYIVVPLVDNGSIRSKSQEKLLVSSFQRMGPKLKDLNLKVVFESDYEPLKLASLINKFSAEVYGINYDIGNSASLGFNVADELDAYGDRIWNVHIKDRLLGGVSVPLGSGAANFEQVFEGLSELGYSGNYILQTAREPNGFHEDALMRYLNHTLENLSNV